MRFHVSLCMFVFMFITSVNLQVFTESPASTENPDITEIAEDCKDATIFSLLDIIKDSLMKSLELHTQHDNSTLTCETDYFQRIIRAAHFMIKDSYGVLTKMNNNQGRKGNKGNTTEKHQKPMDCQEVLENGKTTSGVYDVWPKHRAMNNEPIKMFCDQETEGGGWTVLQRRMKMDKQVNFNVNWTEYKNGFGDIKQEFWLGNENIHALTNQANYMLRVDLGDAENNMAYALYQEFYIEDEENDYKLHIGNYSGTAGDALFKNNLNKFSTVDRRNDHTRKQPCAIQFKGGFWYNDCARGNLNGVYQPGVKQERASFFWFDWKSRDGLAFGELKIKQRQL